MSQEGQCMHCGIEKPEFQHNIYLESKIQQVCTSCLLKKFTGSFCPICFQVYNGEDFKGIHNVFVCCNKCTAVAHLSCVRLRSTTTSTSTSGASISIAVGTNYVCDSCSDPNFNFFNVHRDEQTQLAVPLDQHLTKQLLAASTISQRSMKVAAMMSNAYSEIMAQQAVKAQKEAKEAVEKSPPSNFTEDMPSPNLSDNSSSSLSKIEESFEDSKE